MPPILNKSGKSAPPKRVRDRANKVRKANEGITSSASSAAPITDVKKKKATQAQRRKRQRAKKIEQIFDCIMDDNSNSDNIASDNEMENDINDIGSSDEEGQKDWLDNHRNSAPSVFKCLSGKDDPSGAAARRNILNIAGAHHLVKNKAEPRTCKPDPIPTSTFDPKKEIENILTSDEAIATLAKNFDNETNPIDAQDLVLNMEDIANMDIQVDDVHIRAFQQIKDGEKYIKSQVRKFLGIDNRIDTLTTLVNNTKRVLTLSRSEDAKVKLNQTLTMQKDELKNAESDKIDLKLFMDEIILSAENEEGYLTQGATPDQWMTEIEEQHKEHDVSLEIKERFHQAYQNQILKGSRAYEFNLQQAQSKSKEFAVKGFKQVAKGFSSQIIESVEASKDGFIAHAIQNEGDLKGLGKWQHPKCHICAQNGVSPVPESEWQCHRMLNPETNLKGHPSYDDCGYCSCIGLCLNCFNKPEIYNDYCFDGYGYQCAMAKRRKDRTATSTAFHNHGNNKDKHTYDSIMKECPPAAAVGQMLQSQNVLVIQVVAAIWRLFKYPSGSGGRLKAKYKAENKPSTRVSPKDAWRHIQALQNHEMFSNGRNPLLSFANGQKIADMAQKVWNGYSISTVGEVHQLWKTLIFRNAALGTGGVQDLKDYIQQFILYADEPLLKDFARYILYIIEIKEKAWKRRQTIKAKAKSNLLQDESECMAKFENLHELQEEIYEFLKQTSRSIKEKAIIADELGPNPEFSEIPDDTDEAKFNLLTKDLKKEKGLSKQKFLIELTRRLAQLGFGSNALACAYPTGSSETTALKFFTELVMQCNPAGKLPPLDAIKTWSPPATSTTRPQYSDYEVTMRVDANIIPIKQARQKELEDFKTQTNSQIDSKISKIPKNQAGAGGGANNQQNHQQNRNLQNQQNPNQTQNNTSNNNYRNAQFNTSDWNAPTRQKVDFNATIKDKVTGVERKSKQWYIDYQDKKTDQQWETLSSHSAEVREAKIYHLKINPLDTYFKLAKQQFMTAPVTDWDKQVTANQLKLIKDLTQRQVDQLILINVQAWSTSPLLKSIAQLNGCLNCTISMRSSGTGDKAIIQTQHTSKNCDKPCVILCRLCNIRGWDCYATSCMNSEEAAKICKPCNSDADHYHWVGQCHKLPLLKEKLGQYFDSPLWPNYTLDK